MHLGRCNLLRVSPRKANYCCLYCKPHHVPHVLCRQLSSWPLIPAARQALTLVPTYRSHRALIDLCQPTKQLCRPRATHNWALPCDPRSPPLPCKPVANVFIYQSARHEPGIRCAAQPCNTMAKTCSSRTHSPPCPVPQFLLPGPVHDTPNISTGSRH